MTVEIAIMNLEGVALAADSAVTAYSGSNQKIFSSQNKLFALSDFAPVGVLVYGNASFMSIPWETLIKEYRRQRGTRTLAELNGYLDNFCEFLVKFVGSYISSDHQDSYMRSLVNHVYSKMIRDIRVKVSEELNATLPTNPSIGEQLSTIIDRATKEIVDEFHTRARQAKLVEGAPDDFLQEIRRRLFPQLREIRQNFFKQDLDRTTVRKLNEIAIRAVGAMLDDVQEESSGFSTGIVIAGFGDNDLFPSYSEIQVEGLIGGVLKKRLGREGRCGPDNRAEIVPFAQDDMIHEFMQGIAPIYFGYLYESMISHLDEYTKLVLDSLDKYSDDEREALHERLRNVHPDIADAFVSEVDEAGDQYLASEIVDVVTMLPKDELAEMAEALVSLTSLKRKVSLQDETVGGPTDVAVITKGDGLIWTKRKHYFPAALNPAYFARKYGGGHRYATENIQSENEERFSLGNYWPNDSHNAQGASAGNPPEDGQKVR